MFRRNSRVQALEKESMKTMLCVTQVGVVLELLAELKDGCFDDGTHRYGNRTKVDIGCGGRARITPIEMESGLLCY